MKGKLLTIALGAAMSACSATAANDSYTVTAQLPAELNGKTAFLVNFDTGEKIDSVAVANGTAIFKGNIANPVLARLIVDGNRAGQLILENGNITVKDRTATGSQLNDKTNALNDQIKQRFSSRRQSLPNDSTAEAAMQQLVSEFNSFTDSVIQANIDNPIGYILVLDKAYSMPISELKAFLEANPSFKSHQRITKIIDAAEKKEATQPGKQFVDFSIKTDTTTQKLSDYVGKGKPVLVDFWASWCGPCIRETKVLKEILNEYGPQGLEVLGVAVWDEPENTIAAVKRHNLPWPQIINAQAIPTDLYGITGIPCIILIGPDGTILSRDKQDEELRADIRAYFNGTLTPESLAAPADSIHTR